MDPVGKGERLATGTAMIACTGWLPVLPGDIYNIISSVAESLALWWSHKSYQIHGGEVMDSKAWRGQNNRLGFEPMTSQLSMWCHCDQRHSDYSPLLMFLTTQSLHRSLFVNCILGIPRCVLPWVVPIIIKTQLSSQSLSAKNFDFYYTSTYYTSKPVSNYL